MWKSRQRKQISERGGEIDKIIKFKKLLVALYFGIFFSLWFKLTTQEKN